MRALIAFTLVLVVAGCTRVFFQPHGILVNTPGLYGMQYESVELRAEDGVALFAWFLPARGKPHGTVLYLHGNAENISTHFQNVAWMPAAGFNVLALDYRGYGGSAGRPSLPGVQLDIDAAMRTLLARADVDPKRIIIFGQSLGAALAVHYVAHSAYRDSLCAVVLDSPFSDYRRITTEKLADLFITWPFQWLPKFTVNNDYSPEASVRAISPIPVLFIHGELDITVPPHHSQLLYDRAAEPKDLWILPETGHIQAMKSERNRKRLTEFLLRHAGAGSNTAQLRQ